MNVTTKESMTTKRVVTRTRRSSFQGFSFDRGMIPVGDGPLAAFRQRAWEVYQTLPYPTTADEPWRRTDIRRLNGDFSLPGPDAYLDLPAVPERLLRPLVSDRHGGQIRLLPGAIQADVDPTLEQQGVIFTDLESANREHPDLVERILGTVVRPDEGKFAALSAAMAQSGVFVYVPRGVQVEQPLHSLMWAAGRGLAHFSHLVIWLEEGASLTYVHESASPDGLGGQTLHGAVVELFVGANASLRFVELQSLGDNVWNFTHERAVVERDGNLDWIFGAIGSRLTKNFSDLDLVGAGAHGRMSGFYFTDGEQHLDHDTQQNHRAPHTTSDLL
ncbi:MAG: SufD family Fe-S cluster assembly protein, partial [Anaerolineae bacterium]